MPRSIYEDIYKDLKMKIEDNTFAYQELLPSENTLIQTYGCSRNTLRRAVRLLVSCLLYTSPSPRDATLSRMPSSA